ncbi:hypothetical protein [Thalassobacillus hwangdonensis]|uniref:Multidrug ABC transporter ATPase n=1 Tax=Thalassobacillus hwangdonensis TaxID=546108 RepID=A0ABW3KWD0_9BACI
MGMKRDEKDKPKNSSMAKDMEEIKHQGKIMEHMNTNEEVKREGKKPDPKQHDENE